MRKNLKKAKKRQRTKILKQNNQGSFFSQYCDSNWLGYKHNPTRPPFKVALMFLCTFSSIMNLLRYIFSLLFFLALSFSGFTQSYLGGGVSLGFPLSYSKSAGDYNHSLGSPGARVQFTYLPEDATFGATVGFNYSQWLLPVVKLDAERALSMKFNVMNFNASALIKKTFENKNQLVFGPGIGLALMKGKGVSINGKPELISSIIEDSSAFINRTAPYILLSGEYILPVTSDAPVYMGIGGQIQYLYFFAGDTKYRVDIIDDKLQYYQLQPELSGSVVNPAVYVVFYYRFGERK